MAGEKVQTFTESNFKEAVLEASQPVLVDFWAEWCAPCRMVAPVVDSVAAELDGRAIVGKLNIDDNPGVAMQFSVMSIPTLLVFKGGEVVESHTGARIDKGQLTRLIEKHV